MNSKKASLELSVNFLVILIISIVVFGFGIYFLTKMGESATKMGEQINRETDLQIQALLDSGEQIIIYPEQLELKRGRVGVIGVGILNTLRESERQFKIEIMPAAYINTEQEYHDCLLGDPPGYTIDWSCPSPSDTWTYEEFPMVIIKRNENKKISIPITVPGRASSGTYIFDVYVCHGDTNLPAMSCSPSNAYPETGGYLKFRIKVP